MGFPVGHDFGEHGERAVYVLVQEKWALIVSNNAGNTEPSGRNAKVAFSPFLGMMACERHIYGNG
jgi:hypothetical protein